MTPGIDEQSVPVAVAPFKKGFGIVQPPPGHVGISGRTTGKRRESKLTALEGSVSVETLEGAS